MSPDAPRSPTQATLDPFLHQLTQEILEKRQKNQENQEIINQKEEPTPPESPTSHETPLERNPTESLPDLNLATTIKEHTIEEQKTIEDCLAILEKQNSHQSEQETAPQHEENNNNTTHPSSQQNSEENQQIPAPPNGIYSDPETLKTSIKEFAIAHGYAIVMKRSVPGKSMMFKCDR